MRSTTSRGSAEINLFFNWNVDMFQTLQYVNAALARVQPTLPPTAKLTANRLTFAAFPILGYSLTSDTVPQTKLWELANYTIKPRLNRVNGVSMVVVQGGQVPEFQIEPDPAKLLQAQVTVPGILDAVAKSNMIDSPGLLENNHELSLALVSGQTRTPGEISNIVVKTTPAGVPVRIGDIANVSAVGDAGLHDRDGERQAGGAAEYLPAAGQQHRGGGGCGGRRNWRRSARLCPPA